MTSERRVAVAALMAGLLWTASAMAQPIDVASLQRLLQQAPQRELHFQETRESPWLNAPIQSRGTLRSSAAMLEKKVEQPNRETWRILDDRMQRVTPGTTAVTEILFSQAPALAALAHAMRRVVAGDLRALDKDFRLTPGGSERLWTLQLTPRRSDLARHLQQLELQGSGAQLQVIVILEVAGDRTTTRLIYEP